MELVLIWAAITIIVTTVAASKGRSVIGWFIYGALLGIIALIHIALLPAKDRGNPAPRGKRRCPYCGEWMPERRQHCPHCLRGAPLVRD